MPGSDTEPDTHLGNDNNSDRTRVMAAPRPSLSLPPPKPLELSGDIGTKFKHWQSRWNHYIKATQLDQCPPDRIAATLMTCIGEDALRVIEGLEIPDFDTADAQTILDKLAEYCVGSVNEIYERYIFNSRKQEQGESFDTYLNALRTLSKTCNYGPLRDSLIRDRIVIGIRNDPSRKRLLHESKLTLDMCIKMCRAYESTDRRIQTMTTQSEEPDDIHQIGKHRHRRGEDSPNSSNLECSFCGKWHANRDRNAPRGDVDARIVAVTTISPSNVVGICVSPVNQYK